MRVAVLGTLSMGRCGSRERVGAEKVIRPRDLDERIEAAGTSTDDLAAYTQRPTVGNTGSAGVAPWCHCVGD
jgi:hypothetical protein